MQYCIPVSIKLLIIMLSTIITLDISTQGVVKKEFVGGVFRGWLGNILKCRTNKNCPDCEESLSCPYFMVFKEKSNVKPYSILAFKNKDSIRGFIRIHGEKRKLVPKILSCIQSREDVTHFGGHRYRIDSIEAKNIDMKPANMSKKIRLATTSPLAIVHNGQTELLPSMNTILRSCIRTYNRISKYHDPKNYPYHVTDEIMESNAEIIDFDIKSVEYEHTSMDKKVLKLHGIEGWIEYDSSCLTSEIATILGIGESLQIGKHTAYGFGGFLILAKEELT